jgi:hypothetical protein
MRRLSFVPHWPKGFRCSSPIGTSGDIFRCVIPYDEAMTMVSRSAEGMRRVGVVLALVMPSLSFL